MSNPPAPGQSSDYPRKEMAAEPPKSGGGGIFSYPGFRKLFFGSLSGTLADRIYQMSLIAAANVMFAGTASENKVVEVQIFGTLPGLLLYSISGSLVDTSDRRRLMSLIKGLKIVFVLLLVPLVWKVTSVNGEGDAQLLEQLRAMWPWCLAVVVLLNIVSVPFSPARAATVPDVAPSEHQSLGASLMATTGLISLLIGSGLAGYLARRDVLGPAFTVVVSSALYLVATLFFTRLPDNAAVPGNQRPSASGENITHTGKMTLGQYVVGLWHGIVYCFKHPSILCLIFFETVFWTVGSAFYVLLLFHARSVFKLGPDDLTQFFGVGLLCAGVGLFGGAIGIGRICGKLSPIASYTPAFILITIGLGGVFLSSPENGHAPYWVYAVLLALGLGGGMMLGRVDADVLAIAQEHMRGRVFAIKAMVFAATVLATMLFISEAQILREIYPPLADAMHIGPTGLSDEQKAIITHWIPRALILMLPFVFIFSWIVDIAVWARKPETEIPGQLHRAGYWLFRTVSWIIFKILFRYEVIGAENVPMQGPLILAPNHASFIDPVLLGVASPRHVQYIMYSSYYRSFAHPLFRFLRCIPVDESGRTGALKAGLRSLKKDACLGIFPEGHVSDDGKLQQAQGGVLFLAQRSGAPVVPVAIKGNFNAFPRGAWLPRPAKITAIIGKPFMIDKDASREKMAEQTDELMRWLAEKLELEPPPKSSTADAEK